MWFLHKPVPCTWFWNKFWCDFCMVHLSFCFYAVSFFTRIILFLWEGKGEMHLCVFLLHIRQLMIINTWALFLSFAVADIFRWLASARAVQNCNQILHLFLVMKYFYPDGSGLFQTDSALIYRAWSLTQLSCETDGNPVFFAVTRFQSKWTPMSDFEWRVRQRSPTSSSKHRLKEY